jgi:tRNA (cytidine/uridine-2'-O-)-methyltransferase
LILTSSSSFGIVLVEPRIPQNVGNIGRLCACTNTKLILIGDLGFEFSEKQLQRAGLDYLEHITPEQYPDLPDLALAYPEWAISFIETGASQCYTQIPFQNNHFLVFGSETQGLPSRILSRYPEQCFSIPMHPDRRSLNLSNSVSIVLYEGLRQEQGF